MKDMMMVKIEDIGQPAVLIQEKGGEVELELLGERFWMPRYLVKVMDFEDAA